MLTYEWLVEEGNLFVLIFGTLFIVIVAGTAWQLIRMRLCNILKVQENSYGRNPYYGTDTLKHTLMELADVAKKAAAIEERCEAIASRETIAANRELCSAIVNIINRTGCTLTIIDPEGKTLLEVGGEMATSVAK